MRFLDFIKKFREKDTLAAILKKAVKNIDFRPDFYKTLLESGVYVLVFCEGMEAGEQVIKEDEEINIIKMKNGKIPFFSSKEKIFDNDIIKEGVTYISLRGRDFFKITKGETLILNPYSKSSKEFLSEEIEDILSGSMPGMDIQPLVIKNHSEIIIGLPAERPKEMIESIKSYCEKIPEIESVYLALFQIPEKNAKPHTLIAVEAEGNFHEIFGDLEQVIKPYLNPGDILDMTPLKGSSFESYFTTIDPIYRK